MAAGMTAAATRRQNAELLFQLVGKVDCGGVDKKLLHTGEGEVALDAWVTRDSGQHIHQRELCFFTSVNRNERYKVRTE